MKEPLNNTVVVGTFDWIAIQKKNSTKNFFGKSKRFQGPSKFEKKPAPTSYKLNVKWGDQANILKTISSFNNFKSVYYN